MKTLSLRRSALVLIVTCCVSMIGCLGSLDDRIVITEHDWDAALVIEHVIAIVLEDRLGLEVDLVPVELVMAFAAMHRGDGSMDVAPDFWIPNRGELYEQYVAEGSREKRAGQPSALHRRAGFLHSRLRSGHTMASVTSDDLADPENAKLFDSDGNGLGEYWVGPTRPGTRCRSTSSRRRATASPNISSRTSSPTPLLKAKLKTDYQPQTGYYFLLLDAGVDPCRIRLAAPG